MVMNLDVDISCRVGTFQLRAEFCLTGSGLGVFGPSGSGKSTLFNVLAGLCRAESGHIRLDGCPLVDVGRKINLPPEKRRIGLVFQQAHLFPHLTVRGNLEYGLRRLPPVQRRYSLTQLSAMLELEPLLGNCPAQLSGGERQRVALARAVLACPRLLLMDEPFNGLDERLKRQVVQNIRGVLHECGIPILFCSHSLREMRWMTSDVVVLEHGRNQAPIATQALARSSLRVVSR